LLLANGWIIKICDLGFCKRLSAGNETFSMLGTAGSTAPEIILETGYGYKCDFFSVGVAFF
jgi:serine/threonine protein kinase